jgi:hypothetical protein
MELKTYSREKTISSTIMLGKLDICMLNTQIRSLSLTLHENHFRWIKDLNVSSETLTLLEENIEKILEDIVKDNFLNRIPIAQEIRVRIDKWDCIELENFCSSQETITE